MVVFRREPQVPDAVVAGAPDQVRSYGRRHTTTAALFLGTDCRNFAHARSGWRKQPSTDRGARGTFDRLGLCWPPYHEREARFDHDTRSHKQLLEDRRGVGVVLEPRLEVARLEEDYQRSEPRTEGLVPSCGTA